jgi:hypothetical protein
MRWGGGNKGKTQRRHLLKKRQQRSPLTAGLEMRRSSHTGREEKQRSSGAEARGGYEQKSVEVAAAMDKSVKNTLSDEASSA